MQYWSVLASFLHILVNPTNSHLRHLALGGHPASPSITARQGVTNHAPHTDLSFMSASIAATRLGGHRRCPASHATSRYLRGGEQGRRRSVNKGAKAAGITPQDCQLRRGLVAGFVWKRGLRAWGKQAVIHSHMHRRNSWQPPGSPGVLHALPCGLRLALLARSPKGRSQGRPHVDKIRVAPQQRPHLAHGRVALANLFGDDTRVWAGSTPSRGQEACERCPETF